MKIEFSDLEISHLLDKINDGDITGSKELDDNEINLLNEFVSCLPENIGYFIKKIKNFSSDTSNIADAFGFPFDSLFDMQKKLKDLKKHPKLHSDKKNTLAIVLKTIKSEIKHIEAEETEKIKKIFSRRLDDLYFSKYKSQKELEEELQVTQQTVNSYLNGNILPSYEKIIKISKFLGCSVDYLINEEVSETNITNDKIYKDIGLNSKSINILRSLKSGCPNDFYDISFTLNNLIKKHCSVNELQTDVLTALTEFFKDSEARGSLHTISNDTLDMLKDHLQEMQSVDDISWIFNNFINVLEEEEKDRKWSFLDTQILHLKNIEDKLKNVADDMRREYIENLQSSIEE
ncbi:MAG: helix-turn-helix domain-containing protein [Marinisporobacter sp.]|jgi:transcriptional regulator with XRE-family HTH domain|nr:helix-turn-helix domain-containing protein [Marinisporobacter sp.]